MPEKTITLMKRDLLEIICDDCAGVSFGEIHNRLTQLRKERGPVSLWQKLGLRIFRNKNDFLFEPGSAELAEAIADLSKRKFIAEGIFPSSWHLTKKGVDLRQEIRTQARKANAAVTMGKNMFDLRTGT